MLLQRLLFFSILQKSLISGARRRTYTRGAEKLFHRVDWDRAVGLVIVVDPFDPGSLLYLPAQGYTDLIKTALANRSPLVVVHGLNDEIPAIAETVDTQVVPNVKYRTFSVAGKVVHKVPIPSQNSPLPMYGWPQPAEREPSLVQPVPPTYSSEDVKGLLDPLRVLPEGARFTDGTEINPRPPLERTPLEVLRAVSDGMVPERESNKKPEVEPKSPNETYLDLSQKMLNPKDIVSMIEDQFMDSKGNLDLHGLASSPQGWIVLNPPFKVGLDTPNTEDLRAYMKYRYVLAKLSLLKGIPVPSNSKVVSESKSGRKDQSTSLRGADWYNRLLNDIRSHVGIGVYRTLRSVSSTLARVLRNPRPRNWREFLPEELSNQYLDSSSKFLEGVISPKLRPFVDHTEHGSWNRSHAALLYLYGWAGATLTARSARSLQWTFQILKVFINLWNSNGLKAAVSCFDECTRILMKFISGEIVTHSIGTKIPVSIDKGLPKLIPRGMRRYIRDGHVVAIRLAFFALSITRLIKFVGPTKLSTITDPYRGRAELSPSLEEEIRKACESLIKLARGCPPSLKWKRFHPTIKAGPMAKALISAPLDAVALTSDANAWNSFQDLARRIHGTGPLVSNTEFLAWLTLTLMKSMWSPLLGKLPLGKLSIVREPRGKARVVAIPGYQVQSLLKPIHDSLYSFLERLPTDHTHNQDEGVKLAMTSGAKVMNSYDLSAATDRFPKWFEENVLKNLYSKTVDLPSDFAKAWSELLGSLDFHFKETPKGRLQVIKYGSGQPMGTYSSWASFAVSHHVVVQMAALRAGMSDYVDYALLGDDVVLWGDTDTHDKCFGHYREIMDELGLSINPLKGVSSRNGTFEFAKRFVRGRDVLTGVRWKELASIQNWNGVYSFLLSLGRRGVHLPHLRVALEVGYALVNRKVYHLDLTDLRRVPLVTQRGLREALVLLCSPTGPYKVPFVGWLSFRGICYVDFHPNLGHFYNSIERVVMGHDYGYPIAIGLNQVRRALAVRLMDARGVAFETLKALSKTTVMRFKKKHNGVTGTFKSPEEIGCLRLQHTLASLGKAIREVLGTSPTNFADILRRLGVFYKHGEAGLQVADPQILTKDNDCSAHLMMGLVRCIIVNSPGFHVNSRILLDLLKAGAIRQNPDVNPDYPWLFQGFSGTSIELFESLSTRIERMTDHVVPEKFKHPAQVMTEVKDCITDYMKISVADILPSCLPSHLDTMDAKTEVSASSVLKAWRSLRQDATYLQGTIFTFAERTDRSLAPGFMLEYTNSIRLCAKPSVDPLPKLHIAPIRRPLCDLEFNPLVYIPREEYAKRFPPLPRGEWYQQKPLNMGLQDIPEAFRARLTDSGLFGR